MSTGHYNPEGPLYTEQLRRALVYNGNTFTQHSSYELSNNGGWTIHWRCRECLKGFVSTKRNTKFGADITEPVPTRLHRLDCVTRTNTEIVNFKAKGQLLYHLRTAEEVKKKSVYRAYAQDLQNEANVSQAYVNDNGHFQFPSQLSLKSACQRAVRHRHPPLPHSIAELTFDRIHAHFGTLHNGAEFLLFVEDLPNGTKIVCFATDEFLSYLCTAPVIYADGTFKVVPRIINGKKGQLFTMHVMREAAEICVPCVYAYLPDKTEAVYTVLFTRLKEACQARGLQLWPPHIVSDYESGLLPAFRSSFPASQLRGCFFHYSQALYKFVAGHHYLREMYAQLPGGVFRAFTRMLIALAFLPPALVLPTYNQLCEMFMLQHPDLAQHESGEVLLFLQYYEDQWLTNATIPIAQWNVFDRQHEHVAERTNNAVEGWHNRVNGECGTHPDLWIGVGGLYNEQEHFQLLLGQAAAGQRVVARDGLYVRLQEGLTALRNEFIQNEYADPLHYVRAVSMRVAAAYWEK